MNEVGDFVTELIVETTPTILESILYDLKFELVNKLGSLTQWKIHPLGYGYLKVFEIKQDRVVIKFFGINWTTLAQ